MLADSAGGWTAGATAAVGLLGALLGALQYVNYRSKRDRIAAVGAAFETVVAALSSESDVQRLAGAIRLRRFFDRDSEVGVARAAYSKEALGVIAGILRDQPTGNFQKLLADGLAFAPSLVDADLQRTNLQGAYLGEVDATEADFYRADLSNGSLKDATVQKADFYQTNLVGTVFTRADLRRAKFFQADLARARFVGARLTDATFVQCRSVPVDVAVHLDDEGRYAGPDTPLEAQRSAGPAPTAVFVSRPSALTAAQEAVWRLIQDTVSMAGAEIVTVPRTDYPHTAVLGDIRRVIASCGGVVVLGFRQLEIPSAHWRRGTSEERVIEALALATPWNQVEVGIAVALGLPVFVVKELGVEGGVFDVRGDATTAVVDLDDVQSRADAHTVLGTWVHGLTP